MSRILILICCFPVQLPSPSSSFFSLPAVTTFSYHHSLEEKKSNFQKRKRVRKKENRKQIKIREKRKKIRGGFFNYFWYNINSNDFSSTPQVVVVVVVFLFYLFIYFFKLYFTLTALERSTWKSHISVASAKNVVGVSYITGRVRNKPQRSIFAINV